MKRVAVLASALAVVLGMAAVSATNAGSGAASPAAVHSDDDLVHPLTRARQTLGEDARHGLAFEDVTERLGLAYEPAQYEPRGALQGMTSALAATRLDGVLTLLAAEPAGPVRLFQRQGGSFVDRTHEAGLDGVGPVAVAGFADLDGDGADDLVLGFQQTQVLRVFINDGSGRFHDVTERSGVESRVVSDAENVVPAMRGIAFGDVDRDGHVDIVATDWNPSIAWLIDQDVDGDADSAACRANEVVAGYPRTGTSQSRLYLGNGDGTFRDATTAWGLDLDPVFAFTPQLVDLDGDGWLDLFVTGGVCTSRVFRNDSGHGFVDITAQALPTMTPQASGSVLRDIDGDGVLDWLVTGTSYPTADGSCPFLTIIAGCSGNRLYLGNGDGTFREATDDLGLRDSGWGWGVVAEDFANTGDLQIAVTNGFQAGALDPRTQWGVYYDHFDDDPLAFFVRDGDRFLDVAPEVGLRDAGIGHGLLDVDVDDDGRLDLLVNNADTGLRLFRNITSRSGRHWVRIALDDPTTPTNRAGWGSRVRVSSASGATTCWIVSNGSYQSQALPECQVGLGADDAPVTVEVWWPGMAEPQRHDGVAVDRLTTLRRRP